MVPFRIVALSLPFVLVACGGKDGGPSPEPSPFSLAFEAVADGAPASCSSPFTLDGRQVGVSDLRFYVSNLQLLDADGGPVDVILDEDEFQYAGANGWVGLVDLTSDAEGDCAASAINFSEGTARTHTALTGSAAVEDVVAVSFDVGVPQALMQEVIAANTVEAAPSPLDEMYWSWATGYRHFVFNHTVVDGDEEGEGYLHLGSTACAGDGYLALEDRDVCGFVNTPKVSLPDFDLAADTVKVDLAAALSGLDLEAPEYDPVTFEVIGTQPGTECHSSPMQDDCPTVFANFGLEIATGEASATADAVFRAGLIMLLALLAIGCEPEPVVLDPATPDETALRELLALPDHFQVPRVPDHNPLTADKIELGRRLFYDRRLSGNQTQSCADCHLPAESFADGKVTPTGSTGDRLVRNSPGLANVAWRSTLTWAHDGLLDLEDQILVPLTAEVPTELGVHDGVADEVLARFEDDPDYAERFSTVFPTLRGEVTLDAVSYALASFCRSLVSSGSPFDRFQQGDRAALTEQQLRGMTLFNGEAFECFHCHGGTMFTASYRDADTGDDELQRPFFNTGLYDVDGEGSYPPYDQGLFELTFDPDHRGFFRPPSLRNVALTPPYLHDGSAETLREVVETYAAGGRLIEDGPWAGDGRANPLKSGLVRAFSATDEEIDAVVAFLEALSDPTFATDPRYADPFAAER